LAESFGEHLNLLGVLHCERNLKKPFMAQASSDSLAQTPATASASACSEITTAIEFLCKYLEGVSEDQLELFKRTVSNTLISKFQNHWFEEAPHRGSAYRCLRSMPGKMDPLFLSIERSCGISLKHRLPENFSLWIDPGDVSCRLGEQGGVWSLSEAKSARQQRAAGSSISTSPSSSPPSTPISKRANQRSASITFVPCSPQLISDLNARRASSTSPSNFSDSACSLSEDSLSQDVFRDASVAGAPLLQA
jgi:hypothetical protein